MKIENKKKKCYAQQQRLCEFSARFILQSQLEFIFISNDNHLVASTSERALANAVICRLKIL